MDIVKVIGTSLASIITLFILTKLLGNRQMSQLSMFDYIVGISIGSIAAEMATNIEGDALLPFLGMLVYAGVSMTLSMLDDKSKHIRTFVLGKPLVLLDNGTLYYRNLKKAKLDLTEFLTECRNRGYFDLTKIQLAIFESNGRISFLPMESDRPLTPADMQFHPVQTRPQISVVLDGQIQHESLKATGNNESWLEKELKKQGYRDEKEVLLALVDTDNRLSIYERNEQKTSKNFYS